jgi:hypothetical protein
MGGERLLLPGDNLAGEFELTEGNQSTMER